MTDPSTVIISQRGVRPRVPRCMGFEFEDRAAEMLDAVVLGPTHSRWSRRTEWLIGGTAKRFAPVARLSPRFRTEDGPEHADLLIMHCQFPGDVMLVHSLPRWRARVGKAVVFVEEMWGGMIDYWGGHLGLLEQFDHVYVGISSPAAALADRLDTPVTYMPYSVDTARFAPTDPLATRTIDVLNIGRRSAVTHRALLAWSLAEDRFYYFDSYNPREIKDAAEHRIMYARLHQQAVFAISNRGVGADTVDNEGEEALPARFFEAAAAGGVLVGKAPSIPEMVEEFGWTDSIIDTSVDVPDMPERLAELRTDADRMQAIRLRNLEEMSRRHDSAHRLRTMLESVSMPVPQSVGERIAGRTAYADGLAARREALV